MSLQLKITALAQAIGADIKTLKANDGSLAALTTTQKTSLVGAINELNAALATAGNSLINDAAVAGTTNKTYSADKILTLLNTVKTDIIGGASSAYDTLLEIQNLLQGEDTSIANLLTAVGNRVRFDAVQTLTGAQQTQALTNIGAVAASAVGNTENDFAAEYAAAKL